MMRRALRVLSQVALLAFVAWYLSAHWAEYRGLLGDAHLEWTPLLESTMLVLLSYVVLIQTWRQTVEAWGERLDFVSAMRIWGISNLGKYVPGKYWSIAAMGTLAHEAGVSPVAAMGSSLVVQLVNLVTGFAVFFLLGARSMDVPKSAIVAIVLIALTLLASPQLIPLAGQFVNRVTGRSLTIPRLPPRAIRWAAVGTTLAWLMYGLAFQFFAEALTDGAVHGSFSDWTAVFVGSYLVGFIAVFSPGGLGAREVAMAEALKRTELAVGATAALLVAASRVWLTILEIIPGVIFLLVRPLDRNDTSTP